MAKPTITNPLSGLFTREAAVIHSLIQSELPSSLVESFEAKPEESTLTPEALAKLSPEEQCQEMQKSMLESMQAVGHQRFSKMYRPPSAFRIPAPIKAQLRKHINDQAKKLEPPRLVFKQTTFLEDPAFTFSFGAIFQKGTEVLLQECNDPTNKAMNWFDDATETVTAIQPGYCLFRVPSIAYGPARMITMPVEEAPLYFENVGGDGDMDTGISQDLVTIPGLLVGTSQKVSTMEEFMSASRKELVSEKRIFKTRLQKELATLEKINRERARLDDYSNVLMGLENQIREMLINIDKVPFQEVDAGTVNDIPAFFIPDPQKKPGAILFSKGSFNFSLAFHEMGHALQFNGPSELKYRDEGLNKNVTLKLDSESPEDQLIRESYVYNMNAAYFLFKIGYGSEDEMYEFSNALMNNDLGKLNELSPDLCRMVGGKLPKIYELVKKLSDKVNSLPDFNQAEKSSAIALILAYRGVDIDPYGYIHSNKDAYRNLLMKFYQAHFEAEAGKSLPPDQAPHNP